MAGSSSWQFEEKLDSYCRARCQLCENAEQPNSILILPNTYLFMQSRPQCASLGAESPFDIAALQEKERHLRALTENSPDLIARLDRDCRHLYVNSAIERAFNIQGAQIL